MTAELLNTRETALGIWILIAITAMLFKKTLRIDISDILKALFVWKIMSWLVLMTLYISAFIYLFYRIGLWAPNLLKDTLFYILFSATVGLYKVNKISENKHFFKEILKENLKFGILFEFLIGQYTFALWIELLIVPIAVLLAGVQAFSATDPKHAQVNKIINKIWMLSGLIVIYHVVTSVVQHIHDLLSLDILRQILLVPNLTLVFIPFLYILSLRMVYEEQFIMLGFKLPNGKLKRYAKRKAIWHFNTDLKGLKRWVGRWHLSRPQTREEIDSTIKALKTQQTLEKNPLLVARDEGWSPYLAKDWLRDGKLKPMFYDPAYENKWSARSGTLTLNKDWSGNGINYSVTGTRLAADQVELRLAVYEPKELNELITIFRDNAISLYKAAVNAEPPLKLSNALINQKNMRFKQDLYDINLEKSIWGNINKSYDLIFTIGVSHQQLPH